MFDIGWSELVLIGVVALIVIGPKELPGVLRAVGHWTGKLRRMAAEFQGQFNEAMREAEVAELKKQVEEINDSARSIGRFDPLSFDAGKIASAPSGETTPSLAAPAPASDASAAAATVNGTAASPAASDAPGAAPPRADPVEPTSGEDGLRAAQPADRPTAGSATAEHVSAEYPPAPPPPSAPGEGGNRPA